MKYFLSYLLYVAACMSFISYRIHSAAQKRASDDYVRERVFLLGDDKVGHCTGVQVKAPSGKVFMLTAEHCKVLLVDDVMTAVDEEGKVFKLDFWAVDQESDLMLLEKANDRAIPVATKVEKHEQIHTLTHGGSLPTYRTDGEFIGEKTITVNRLLENDEQVLGCPNTKNQALVFGDFALICQRTLTEMLSTARVAPGSSGGPVLNADGELVGIVSASDEIFSDFVPLHVIQDFLKGL